MKLEGGKIGISKSINDKTKFDIWTNTEKGEKTGTKDVNMGLNRLNAYQLRDSCCQVSNPVLLLFRVKRPYEPRCSQVKSISDLYHSKFQTTRC